MVTSIDAPEQSALLTEITDTRLLDRTVDEVFGLMLGTPLTVSESAVAPTNILAGAWKSKIAALHAACLLSVPTVVTGTHYDIHRKTSTFRMTRSYWFRGSPLTINIFGEWPQAGMTFNP